MLQRESVLKDKEKQNHNGIDFKELSNVPKINLRGQSNNKDFMSKASKILNTLLPTKPNTSIINDDIKVIDDQIPHWFGPFIFIISFLIPNLMCIILNSS